MLKIKATNLQSLTDARYFAAREVEWLAFNFVESDYDYIAPNVAAAIFEWVEGAKIVGIIDFPTTAQEALDAAQHWGWQVVELGQLSDPTVAAQLSAAGIVCHKSFAVEPFTNGDALARACEPFAPTTEAIQLNFSKNNITWSQLQLPDALITVEDLKNLTNRYKILLDIDFDGENLANILKELPNLYGITLKGGEEEAVGVKSFDQIEAIFDALEAFEENQLN